MKNNSTDRIKELTAKYPAEKYDELIRGDDAEVFYHLSSLRHTLFSWYPFAGYERALVLGDQCGALASGLAERFAHTDILLNSQGDTTVIKNRFSNRSELSIIYTYPRESYDCILYMQRDVKEDPSNVLPELQHLLKEDGVLLAGLINSSGIRHLYDGTPGDGYDRDTYRKYLLMMTVRRCCFRKDSACLQMKRNACTGLLKKACSLQWQIIFCGSAGKHRDR